MSVGFKATIPLSERSGWHVVGEAPHGLGGWVWSGTAAPCQSGPFHGTAGTLLPAHRAGEVPLPSVGGTGGKCRHHSNLWCGEVNHIFPCLAFHPEELRCLFQYPPWSWCAQKLLPSWRRQSPASAACLPPPGAGLLSSHASSAPDFSLHQLEEKPYTWLRQLLSF